MATKTKSSETAAPVPSTSLEATFSEGLKQLDAGNLEAAAATFSSVQEQASATEQLNLGRAARGYLAAIQARIQERAVERRTRQAEFLSSVMNTTSPTTMLPPTTKWPNALMTWPA